MTIKNIDKATCRKLQADMEEALRSVGQKHGVKITSAGGRFEPTGATLKFLVKVTDQAVIEKDQQEKFNMTCFVYDLKPEHYRKEIVVKGDLHRLVGFESSRPKYCAMLQNVATGKVTLWSAEVLDKVRGGKDRMS